MEDQLDDMLLIMLSLVKAKKTKHPAERAMINTLSLLGLAEYSKGCYRATSELIRLAYQSENFLSENSLALALASDTIDEDLEDLEKDLEDLEDVKDITEGEISPRKRKTPSKKRATPKVDASSSKKKAK